MMRRFNLYARLWLLPLLFTFGTQTYASDSGFEELDAWQLESALSLAQRRSKKTEMIPKHSGWQHAFRMQEAITLRL